MDFSEYNLLDTTTIDQIRSFSEDDSMVKELFKSFLNDSHDMLGNINNIISQDHSSLGVKADIHSMKGVSGTIGAIRLHEILKAIDAKLKTEDTNNINSLYTEMNGCFDELEQLIQSNYLST